MHCGSSSTTRTSGCGPAVSAVASGLARRRPRGGGGARRAGSVKRNAAPRGARFSAQIRPPCAVTIARQIGEAEARRRGPPARAVELLEHALLARPAAGPGPRPRPRPRRRAPSRARRHANGALRGGVYLQRVLEQVDEQPARPARRRRHQRQVGGRPRPRPRGPPSVRSTRAERRADQLLERVPLALELAACPTRAASCRAGCRPGGSAARPPRRSSAASSRARRGAERRRLEQRARGAGDGGERRAQVVRHRAQQRAAQALALHGEPRRARASSASRARSSGARDWRASASSRSTLVRRQRPQRSARAARPARPARLRRPTQRHVERRRAPGSVSVPRPAAPPVVEGPLRHRALARVAREGRHRVRHRLEPAARRGQEHTAGPCRTSETWRAPIRGDLARRVRAPPARGSARRATWVRCSRSRARLGLRRARARASVLISRPTTSITAKVHEVLRVGHREGEVRRHEEEVEGGDAEHRGQHRRAAAVARGDEGDAQQVDHRPGSSLSKRPNIAHGTRASRASTTTRRRGVRRAGASAGAAEAPDAGRSACLAGDDDRRRCSPLPPHDRVDQRAPQPVAPARVRGLPTTIRLTLRSRA